MKKRLLVLLLLFAGVSSAFSAQALDVMNGYDASLKAFTYFGTGQTVSKAVLSAYDGLEDIIREAVKNRCQDIYTYFEGKDIDAFLRYMATNLDLICRDTVRYARSVDSYQTSAGYAMVYSVSASDFEGILEYYISASGIKPKEMKRPLGDVVNANRSFQFKYRSGEMISIGTGA